MKMIGGVALAGALAAGAALMITGKGEASDAPKIEHMAFCFGREYLDGPALEASCADHKIWTVDAKGNQYVMATPTMAVRCITTDGMVRTIAGDDRYLPYTGAEEGPACMLPSELGGAEAGHPGGGVYLTVKGLPRGGEDKGCIYTAMGGYPSRLFKNKEKGGRWWYKVVGKGGQPLPAKAGDSVAFKDVNLKGVVLRGEAIKAKGRLYD